jgi:hypothetical protein
LRGWRKESTAAGFRRAIRELISICPLARSRWPGAHARSQPQQHNEDLLARSALWRLASARLRSQNVLDAGRVPDPWHPPSPLPGKLCIVIDGTGVPVTCKETAGREGKGADGRARTREVKLTARKSGSPPAWKTS